jgi:hypothetical protein
MAHPIFFTPWKHEKRKDSLPVVDVLVQVDGVLAGNNVGKSRTLLGLILGHCYIGVKVENI